MNKIHNGVIKHPHSEGKSGKVYIGETLKQAVEVYNERNPRTAMPVIQCSGKSYYFRLLAAAGRELESSDLFHKFYGNYSFHEMETAMSRRKYEFQQELRRICQNLADKFPHVQATADLWAAYEAVKGKLCNRKAERRRTARLRAAQSASNQSNGNQADLAYGKARNTHSIKALGLVEARRRKAAARREATALALNEEDFSPRPEFNLRASLSEASILHPNDEIHGSITDQKRVLQDEPEEPTECCPPNEDKACSSEDDVLPRHSAKVLLKLKVKNSAVKSGRTSTADNSNLSSKSVSDPAHPRQAPVVEKKPNDSLGINKGKGIQSQENRGGGGRPQDVQKKKESMVRKSSIACQKPSRNKRRRTNVPKRYRE